MNLETPISKGQYSKTMSWEEIVNLVCQQVQEIDPDVNIKDFKEWYQSKEDVGKPFDSQGIYVAYRIYKNRLLKDRDNITIVCGLEGEGKTTWAINQCALIDPNYQVNATCFTQHQFFKCLKNLPKFSSIQIDEGGTMLFSREAMKSGNIMLNKILMVIRSRNLNVVVCIPDFWSLDSYVREHRANLLIFIPKRGHYKAITRTGIQYICTLKKKYRNLNAIKLRPDTFWLGSFTKSIPKNFNYTKYLDTKEKYNLNIIDEALKNDKFDANLVPVVDVRRSLGIIDQNHFLKRLREVDIPLVKISSKWFMSKDHVEKLTKRVQVVIKSPVE